MNVAIIPARGGSKRIPRKNIKLFNGRPMISYAIKNAMSAGCFDKIIVSTDDLEISKIAEEYGAEVPFTRPDNHSDDYATTLDVMEHASQWIDSQDWGCHVQNICCIYATTPLLEKSYLIEGLELLNSDDEPDYTFSVVKYAHPIQRAFVLNQDLFLSDRDASVISARTQDLISYYHDAGQFYWGRKNSFLKKLPIMSQNSKGVIIPFNQVVDIDSYEDWKLAELLYGAK